MTHVTFSPCPISNIPNEEHRHANLYLLKRNLEAEGLIEIGVQGLLLDSGLLLLESLAILQQVDFHVWV